MADPASADFIRKLPATFTLREMEAALKAEGLKKLTYQRLYQIRKEEKLGFKRAPHSGGARKGKKVKKKVARVTARAALEAIPVKPTVTDNARVQVRKLALQIGLPRIEELVRELKREAGIE
jgi:hypothetical protein